MFVNNGATEKLQQIRRDQFYDSYIASLVEEAKRLGLTAEDIKNMIERGFNK
ncbi:hypothetical protein [Ihubacter massiliensis]